MTDFSFTQYIPLDMEEVRKLGHYPINPNNLPTLQIKRNITITDLKKYLEEVGEEFSIEASYRNIGTLKEKLVGMDAQIFLLAGYKEIFIRDLAPGSTQISYILSSVDYSSSYFD